MNNLHIAMVESAARKNSTIRGSLPGGQGDWEHVNNFNAGTSKDWGGNTMFINSGTFDFAYENSDDSKYHNRWIVVKGSDIDAEKYGNYYYVCFDFEGVPNECKTYYDFHYTDASGIVQSANGEIAGYYEKLQDLKDAGITSLHTYGNLDIDVNKITDLTISRWGQDNMLFRGDNNYSDWIIRLVAATPKKDLPKVKVPTATGGKTTRVIKSGEQVVQSGRVFCEDIVAAQYKYEDLDYNDVVFDAAIVHNYRKLISTYYDKDNNLIPSTPENPNPKIEYDFSGIDGQADGYSEYYAKVCLLAAGGTLPISIQVRRNANEVLYNGEIHNILGKKSSSIMINTLSKNERERVNMATVESYRPAVDLTHVVDGVTTDKFAGIMDINTGITLDVQYGNVAAKIESKYYGGQKDVVASAKFMVPLGTPWAKERVNIANAFPLFPQWVKDETNDDGIVNYPFWEEKNRGAETNFYCDPNYDLAELPGLDPAIWSKGNFITYNGTTYTLSEGNKETTTPLDDIIGSSTSEVDPLNPIFTIPDNQTETILYDFTIPTVGPGYLYDGNQVTVASNTPITTGSKIRIYGVSIDGWEVTLDNQTISASNGGRYATNGYIEFDATSNIGNRLYITGKNFTITYVTIIEATPANNNTTLWQGGPTTGYQEFAIQSGDSKLSTIKDGDVIRIHATQNDNFFVDIHALTGWIIIGSQLTKNNVTWVNGSYFDYTLGSGEGTLIKDNGIKIQMNNMNSVTKVELIHK